MLNISDYIMFGFLTVVVKRMNEVGDGPLYRAQVEYFGGTMKNMKIK